MGRHESPLTDGEPSGRLLVSVTAAAAVVVSPEQLLFSESEGGRTKSGSEGSRFVALLLRSFLAKTLA